MSLSFKDACPAKKSDVWLRQAGKENLLFDPEVSSAHLLNRTALAIWELCDGVTRPAEMIDAICEVTRLPVEVVTEDVERTLNEFEQANLITWTED